MDFELIGLMTIVIIVGLWLATCGISADIGKKRTIGPWIPFFISIFFTPIVGIIVALCSKRLDDIERENRLIAIQEENLKMTKEKNNKDGMVFQLEKLAKIKDSGILTDEEFQKMKEEIMSGVKKEQPNDNTQEEQPKKIEYDKKISINGCVVKYYDIEEHIDGRIRYTIKFENEKDGKIYSVPNKEEYAIIAKSSFINYENKEAAIIALYKYIETSIIPLQGRTTEI